jgi:hypothetical protein
MRPPFIPLEVIMKKQERDSAKQLLAHLQKVLGIENARVSLSPDIMDSAVSYGKNAKERQQMAAINTLFWRPSRVLFFARECQELDRMAHMLDREWLWSWPVPFHDQATQYRVYLWWGNKGTGSYIMLVGPDNRVFVSEHGRFWAYPESSFPTYPIRVAGETVFVRHFYRTAELRPLLFDPDGEEKNSEHNVRILAASGTDFNHSPQKSPFWKFTGEWVIARVGLEYHAWLGRKANDAPPDAARIKQFEAAVKRAIRRDRERQKAPLFEHAVVVDPHDYVTRPLLPPPNTIEKA